ncbi:MAG: radical SAM protein [Actinobacteria bacterium]|nr:radical SAM protein [Actinomycetota bacterium]
MMTALGIVIDQKCNIRCEHCCFSSGPRSTQHMTDATVLDIVRQGVEDPKITTIALSGGEALLRRDLVLSCLQLAKQGGKSSSLVTNGHWGQSRKRALTVLRELKEAGLTSMKISYDDFHAQFIPPARVRNVLDANRSVRIPLSVAAAVTRTSTADASLAALGDSLLGVSVTKFPVQPVGAGAAADPAAIIRTTRVDDEPRCPGFEVTYHFDGQVYPCCSPTVFDTTLALGSIDELSVAEAVESLSHNVLLGILRKRGFRWLLDFCESRGIDLGVTEQAYVDACSICHAIFSKSENLRFIADALRAQDLLVQRV